MKTCFIFILTLLAYVPASAQSMHNTVLRWTSDKAENLKNSEEFQFASIFITSPTDVKWLQKNRQHTTVFSIVSAEGRWSDISKDGKLLLHVSEKGNGSTGSILLERTGQIVTISLDFSGLGPNAMKQKFRVTDVQKEN
ncbi:MAG TPA: hypothetical protein PLV21_07650 [Cyclobacteriaceae bacterium]|nr:hypothetical protein [Cyclobacteriaceae bacterium]HRJ81739.1 hypothetical protein [Cyclobacteriaceae bacterium]